MITRNNKHLVVHPNIPQELKPLVEISKNFWWCWNFGAIELFQSIDLDLWYSSYHNPYRMLGELAQEHIEKLINDESFMIKMETVYNEMQKYLMKSPRYLSQGATKLPETIAYFSAEFGIHESFPNYSGGLGVLAGDHLKSASDIGLPLVAMGLLYRNGYFNQYLNEDGWQQEFYPVLDFHNMAVDMVMGEDEKQLVVDIDFPGRKIYAGVWKVQVGRVSLFLLDTALPQNNQADRFITDKLYGGDKEHRIQQEILLGVGGVRALEKMKIFPTTFHMNEGHSAFSAFERIRGYIQNENLSYREAYEIVKASTVFTTHTPVPAGNEAFSDNLIQKYLEPFMSVFKIPAQEFLDLGRIHLGSSDENFGMTAFSLRVSAFANGVSQLHGQVAQNMWSDLWDNLYDSEVPIDYVTNGIHVPSWIGDEMDRLYRRYISQEWMLHSAERKMWERIHKVPDNELWRATERLKERLVGFVRQLVRKANEGNSTRNMEDFNNLLDPDALTIGFARRFATYKRATLLFKDKERLKKILANKKYPVQFVFAGKAHPNDMEGKRLIREIVHFAREEGFKNKVVFLENYDIRIARYLVQGVDVWLNTPNRPHEASGTSGMKVTMNGGLNLSIPDGWWAEAFAENPEIGWAIGAGEEYTDRDYQDFVESRALYDTLEESVIPLYYERGADGLPKKWIKRIKESISFCTPRFNTDRMVQEYHDKFYHQTGDKYLKLSINNFSELKSLMDWKIQVEKAWDNVSVVDFDLADEAVVPKVSEEVPIVAKIDLNGLKPEDVEVALVYGKQDTDRQVFQRRTAPMVYIRMEGNLAVFQGVFKPRKSGGYGYTLRITPLHPNLVRKLEAGFIRWA